MNRKTVKLQEPKITKNTPVKFVDRPKGTKKPIRRYKKDRNKSTVAEYDRNFNLVGFYILRFK